MRLHTNVIFRVKIYYVAFFVDILFLENWIFDIVNMGGPVEAKVESQLLHWTLQRGEYDSFTFLIKYRKLEVIRILEMMAKVNLIKLILLDVKDEDGR